MTIETYTEPGTDVTHLVGEARTRAVDEAFELFRVVHAENAANPNVHNARRLIRAFEDFERLMTELDAK